MTANLEQGATYNLNQKQIIRATTDYTCSSADGGVDALADLIVTLCDAAHQPRLGDRHRILATGGDVNVAGGLYPVLGGTFVPQGSSAEYELALATGPTFVWVALGAGGGMGVGEILVDRILDVYNLADVSLPNNIYARPRTVDHPFELLKDSLLTADGITIVNALSTGAGPSGATLLPGRWLRNEIPVKRFTEQLTWYFNAAGDLENDGKAPGTAIASVAEIYRRLHQLKVGKNYRIFFMSDMAANDRARWSGVIEGNAEDITPAVGGGAGATAGTESTTNITHIGQFIDSGLSSTMTAYTASTATSPEPANGNQATFADAGFPGAVGDMIVINDPANPTRDGALAWVGLIGSGANGLAAGLIRITDFTQGADNPAASSATMPYPAAAAIASFVANAPYKIFRRTNWNASIVQAPNTGGRIDYSNFDFPAPAASPADQENLMLRVAGTPTFRNCRFRRSFNLSANPNCSFRQCSFDFDGVTPTAPFVGVGGTVLLNFFGSGDSNPANCLFLNADVRWAFGHNILLVGCYGQGSRFASFGTNVGMAYGVNLNNTVNHSAGKVVIGGNGLGIYDWPVVGITLMGLLVADGSQLRVNANIRGRSVTATSVGVQVQGGSEVAIVSGVTPTITAAAAEVRISQPVGGTVDLAVRAGQGTPAGTFAYPFSAMAITAAGAVVLDAQALGTWANWNGAGANNFQRFAFNPHDGSRVFGVVNVP